MSKDADKKMFVRNNGLSLLMGSVVTLGVIGAVSFLFFDQRLFQWQTSQYKIFPEPLALKAFVLLGKAWLPVWLLLCWGVLGNCRKRALIGLISLLLVVSVIPIKLSTQRLRPRNIINNDIPVTMMEKLTHSWSFPSGDTAAAFATAAAAAPFVGWIFRNIMFTAAGFVGFFRVATYAHYASDAIAGAILGIVCGYLGFRLIASKPKLRQGLMKHLSKELMIAAIILIPVIHAASGNSDQIKVFAMFYPLIVGAFYLLSETRKKFLTP